MNGNSTKVQQSSKTAPKAQVDRPIPFNFATLSESNEKAQTESPNMDTYVNGYQMNAMFKMINAWTTSSESSPPYPSSSEGVSWYKEIMPYIRSMASKFDEADAFDTKAFWRNITWYQPADHTAYSYDELFTKSELYSYDAAGDKAYDGKSRQCFESTGNCTIVGLQYFIEGRWSECMGSCTYFREVMKPEMKLVCEWKDKWVTEQQPQRVSEVRNKFVPYTHVDSNGFIMTKYKLVPEVHYETVYVQKNVIKKEQVCYSKPTYSHETELHTDWR